MQAKQSSLTLSLLLTLCLCANVSAQQAGRIESMKLLTPSTGWAATNQKLFWTNDGGSQWKDITPKLSHKRQAVSSVFFLDASTGWVLLNCGDDHDAMADDVCFEFASTTDTGESWLIAHPKIVDPVPQSVIVQDGQGFSGKTFLNFADVQHGWAILKRNLHVEASAGQMLRTFDGGKTWAQLPGGTLPMADHFRFVTAKDGWMAGGGQPESDLYVTHDGGDSWSQVVVKPPTAVRVEVWPPQENGVWPDYQLPLFGSRARGFLIGSYWDGSKPIPALFSTADLGRTWKFERTLPGIDGATAISRETLFVVSTPQSMNRLTLTRLPLGEGTTATSLSADIHGIPIQHSNLGARSDAFDMLDDAHGWLLADELLATSDGGATWVDITPAEARPAGRADAKPSKASAGRRLGSPGLTTAIGLPSNVSMHLAFDKSRVPCPAAGTCTAAQSLTAMQALMNSSPYYDTSLYIPGSPNRGTDAAVNQSWVQGAEQQGWGLVPTWFGLQSSCIINQPNVKQYFGPTTADAST